MGTDNASIVWAKGPLCLVLATLCLCRPATAQEVSAAASTSQTVLTSIEALKQFEAPAGEAYTIADGDELEIQVVGRPELSGAHLVGPDGRITLPIAGPFAIKDMTREDAATKISAALSRYYTSVDVTVRVSKYGSNRILVLGRVRQPGVLYFDDTPTLLDALSKSHAIALSENGQRSSVPSRVAIFRGRDQVVWIDLKSMLDRGAASIDLKLRRDDVVYVPDDQDDQVSVLGEVQHPGIIRLDAKTGLAEVLALAGGLTPTAGSAKIQIVRPGSRVTQEVSFRDLLDPRKNIEVSLRGGDVIYVQKGAMAKFQYVIQQVAPLGTFLLFGSTVLDDIK